MQLGIGLALPTFPLRGGLDQYIRSMFASGEEGAWYDPSDLSTMFTDAAGTTPVTATGQIVGLMLDKRLGMAVSETNLWNWPAVAADPNWTVVGSTASSAGVSGLLIQTPPVLTVGSTYLVRVTVTNYVSGTLVGPYAGNLRFQQAMGNGTYTARLVANTPIAYIYSSSFNGTISDVQILQMAGNSLVQDATASRPIFRDVAGLRYLEFDGVDDYLRATFTIAQPIDRISAIQQVTWTGADYIYDGGSANTGVLYQVGAGTPDLTMYSGATLLLSPSLALGVNGIVTELHNNTSSRIALNNNAYVTGAGGALLPGGITIGSVNTNGAYGNMHLYQLIMRGSTTAMTDAQITTLRSHCATKGGVTL